MSYVNKVYQYVTEAICQLLDEGVCPWRKPWKGGGPPSNITTGSGYRGINNLLLRHPGELFESRFWLTFNQAKKLGAKVRKGSKSTMVVFWKVDRKEVEQDGETTERRRAILRYYRVFNADQVDFDKVPPRIDKRLAEATAPDGENVTIYVNQLST